MTHGTMNIKKSHICCLKHNNLHIKLDSDYKTEKHGFQNVRLIAFSQINVTVRHFEASSTSKLYLNIRLNLLTEKSPPLSLIRRS